MTNIKIETEYKGFTVKWSDWEMGFSILQNDYELKGKVKTIEEVQKWIDAKLKQKFRRVPVLHEPSYNATKQPGTATSIIEKEYAWVVVGDKKSKCKIKDVWLNTERNQEILKEIKEKTDQIINIREEIRDFMDATERLTADMMLEGNGETNDNL